MDFIDELVMDFDALRTGPDAAREPYDLAFVGAGVSCSYSLIHLANLFQQRGRQDGSSDVFKIAVVEKSGEFFTGVPYGGRSLPNSFIITRLNDFLPQQERELFEIWLSANKHWIFEDWLMFDDTSSEQWFNNNQALVDRNVWGDLYLPRYVFGLYLRRRVSQAIKNASAFLEIDLLATSITNLQRASLGFHMTSIDSSGRSDSIRSKRVVLSTGGLPVKELPLLSDSTELHRGIDQDRMRDEQATKAVADCYDPTLGATLDSLLEAMNHSSSTEEKNVVIVGANASALEIVHLLESKVALVDSIDNIVVISRSARWPKRSHAANSQSTFKPVHLLNLIERAADKPIASREIVAAVRADLKSADFENISCSDTLGPISYAVSKALDFLSKPELQKFVEFDGVEIGNMQRRAGGQYSDAATRLEKSGKLTMLQGNFEYLKCTGDGYFEMYFKSPGSTKSIRFQKRFLFPFNCSGSLSLTSKQQTPLYSQLIRDGLCIASKSGKGIQLSEKYEASQGLYVIGPMLAGNSHDTWKVWHAEHCGRLAGFAQQLAEHLFNDVQNSTDVYLTAPKVALSP